MVLQGPGAQAPLVIRVRQPAFPVGSQRWQGWEGARGTRHIRFQWCRRRAEAHTLSFQEAVSPQALCTPREGESAEWRFPAPLPPQDSPGYSRPLWLKL